MTYLIFDFDGTIVDSFSAAMKILNILSLDFNFSPIGSVTHETLKEMDAKTLLKKLNIPMFKIPFILRQAKRLMYKEMIHLLPFPGIPDVLTTLHQSGFQLGIVSSNSEENVRTWLKHHGIVSYFHFIHNAPQYFGKEQILKSSMKKYHIDREQVWYIGDESRDIEAAKKSGIISLAVTWGYNSESLVSQYRPQYIAHTPADIITIVNTNAVNGR